MPGKSDAKGQSHGGGAGHGKSKGREWTGDDGPISEPPPIDQGGPMGPGEDDGRPDYRGRSESSPGHLKKTAGAQSARDFAPGHTARNRPGGP